MTKVQEAGEKLAILAYSLGEEHDAKRRELLSLALSWGIEPIELILLALEKDDVKLVEIVEELVGPVLDLKKESARLVAQVMRSQSRNCVDWCVSKELNALALIPRSDDEQALWKARSKGPCPAEIPAVFCWGGRENLSMIEHLLSATKEPDPKGAQIGFQIAVERGLRWVHSNWTTDPLKEMGLSIQIWEHLLELGADGQAPTENGLPFILEALSLTIQQESKTGSHKPTGAVDVVDFVKKVLKNRTSPEWIQATLWEWASGSFQESPVGSWLNRKGMKLAEIWKDQEVGPGSFLVWSNKMSALKLGAWSALKEELLLAPFTEYRTQRPEELSLIHTLSLVHAELFAQTFHSKWDITSIPTEFWAAPHPDGVLADLYHCKALRSAKQVSSVMEDEKARSQLWQSALILKLGMHIAPSEKEMLKEVQAIYGQALCALGDEPKSAESITEIWASAKEAAQLAITMGSDPRVSSKSACAL